MIKIKNSNAKQKNKEESVVFLKNLSIIVAEDDETSKLFYESFFKNKLKKIRMNHDTNIILMDLKMPDINGYDAKREIRKFNSNIVIIAQTTYGLAEDKEKAIETSCDDYIAIPIKKKELLGKIKAYVNKKNI